MNIISTLTLLCIVPSFVCMGADISHVAPRLTKAQQLFLHGKAQWEILGTKMNGLANIQLASLDETSEEAAKPDSATRWLNDHAAEIIAILTGQRIPTKPTPTAPIKTHCCWKAVLCCYCCSCSE